MLAHLYMPIYSLSHLYSILPKIYHTPILWSIWSRFNGQ